MTDKKFPRDLRTLIVDDHAFSRDFTAAALRQAACSVKQAGTSTEAIKLAASWLPHVMLVDMRLGGTDGRQVARDVLAAWPENLSPPRLVALTADYAMAKQAAGLFDRVLRKPASAGKLLKAVFGEDLPGVREESGSVNPELQAAFIAELAVRVPQLDRCMARLDLAGAEEILHQLIASSALCGEEKLEQCLRALSRSCNSPVIPTELARDYFCLVVSLREYLARITPGRTQSPASFPGLPHPDPQIWPGQ